MVNFNFFEWIRQGVKQSVLLGVSDAVGHWVRLARGTTSASGSCPLSRRPPAPVPCLPFIRQASPPDARSSAAPWETSRPPRRESSKRKSRALVPSPSGRGLARIIHGPTLAPRRKRGTVELPSLALWAGVEHAAPNDNRARVAGYRGGFPSPRPISGGGGGDRPMRSFISRTAARSRPSPPGPRCCGRCSVRAFLDRGYGPDVAVGQAVAGVQGQPGLADIAGRPALEHFQLAVAAAAGRGLWHIGRCATRRRRRPARGGRFDLARIGIEKQADGDAGLAEPADDLAPPGRAARRRPARPRW